MANEKTPNQRLNELRQAAAEERERLQQNQAMSREELGRSAAVLLSLRSLETGALSEKGTVAAIDRTWQKNTAFFNRHMQDFAEKTGPEKLRQLALSADGGKELTEELLKDGDFTQLALLWRNHAKNAYDRGLLSHHTHCHP